MLIKPLIQEQYCKTFMNETNGNKDLRPT